MVCRNKSPRPNNPSLYTFLLPSCYHHLFNPQCLCSPSCFPRSLSNPCGFHSSSDDNHRGWQEKTRDSTSQKNGSRAFGMGCVRSGKEIMYKKQPLLLTTAVPKSLENGIALCSWPVPPVSIQLEKPRPVLNVPVSYRMRQMLLSLQDYFSSSCSHFYRYYGCYFKNTNWKGRRTKKGKGR